MSRYQILRSIGCDPFAAGAIAFMNWVIGTPPNEIRFMHVTMEIEQPAHAAEISREQGEGGR